MTSSIAVGADAHAHPGSAEADPATFFIATIFITTALDITLTRGVCVRMIGLPDDDTAFTTFAPATAIFIADHANVLNVALRCDDTSAESGAAEAAVMKAHLRRLLGRLRYFSWYLSKRDCVRKPISS